MKGKHEVMLEQKRGRGRPQKRILMRIMRRTARINPRAYLPQNINEPLA
jgi:hypothetical protein